MKRKSTKTTFPDPPLTTTHNRVFYPRVETQAATFSIGDIVLLESASLPYLGKITRIYEGGSIYVTTNWLYRPSDVLEELDELDTLNTSTTTLKHEVQSENENSGKMYLSTKSDDNELKYVLGKVEVTFGETDGFFVEEIFDPDTGGFRKISETEFEEWKNSDIVLDGINQENVLGKRKRGAVAEVKKNVRVKKETPKKTPKK